MGPPASDRVTRVRPYSGSLPQASHFAYGIFTLSDAQFHASSAMFRSPLQVRNPRCKHLVWPLSRSLAATWEIDVSFSSCGYLDVSVPRVPPVKLCIHLTVLRLYLSGFPHSDICGSVDICSSPQLFAAYHVLHRLPVPRHPPCALFCLTSFSMLSHQVAFGVASLTCGLD